MKWQTTFYFVLLSSVLAAGQLAPAAAEPAGDEYRLPRAAVDTQIANNGNGKIRGHGKGNKFKTNNLFGTKITRHTASDAGCGNGVFAIGESE